MIAINKILTNLEKDLESIEALNEEILLIAEKGVFLSNAAIEKLKEMVLIRGFKSRKEEIQFFKNTKPKVVARFIYYSYLFKIENKRPISSIKAQQKFLTSQIDSLQEYFIEHQDFYHYYVSGKTSFDNLYFLRENSQTSYIVTELFYNDSKFSTLHDISVAIILAFQKLIHYLKKEKYSLTKREGESNVPLENFSNLSWSGTKVDLIELTYALQTSGNINEGEADIIKIASIFKKVFNIELGDVYRTFLEIRARKINRTKFLDRLKKSLINKMYQADA